MPVPMKRLTEQSFLFPKNGQPKSKLPNSNFLDASLPGQESLFQPFMEKLSMEDLSSTMLLMDSAMKQSHRISKEEIGDMKCNWWDHSRVALKKLTLNQRAVCGNRRKN